ncbi:STAND family AAA ATPase, partial [Enterobacter hormaechei]
AKIMEQKDGGYYKFKYPYVYYFFIAKHLAESIRDEKTVEIINGLVSTLGKRRSMSILMFLTHHSRDESILEKVVEQASKLFGKNKPAKLEMNIKFINDIVDSLPNINFQKQDRLQLRRQIEDSKDGFETGGDIDSFEDDVHVENKDVPKTEEGIDLLKEMNLTFKSLE